MFISDTHNQSSQHKPSPNFNLYIRRYIKYFKLVFLERFDNSDTTIQVNLYKETIQIYKLLAIEIPTFLEAVSWETLITNQLDIHSLILNKHAKPQIESQFYHEEVAEMIIESVLYSTIRSMTIKNQIWISLRNVLSKSLFWNATVSIWSRVVIELTNLMCLQLYGIDMHEKNDDFKEISNNNATVRRKVRNRTLSIVEKAKNVIGVGDGDADVSNVSGMDLLKNDDEKKSGIKKNISDNYISNTAEFIYINLVLLIQSSTLSIVELLNLHQYRV